MNTFKGWVFALVLFFQDSCVLAAATLMGVVRENHVGGSLVKNVSVSALGANPMATGADGSLCFTSRNAIRART
ncbi:hypothetical protein [Nitrosospira sp. Is2]|uniref:hypothetical protein n=1 Tax=Nitrosospira sp. Is2 TaxID=3080532 RepID=UPI0029541349|nr:hypothetical protein [Nitrosospira sp. Is2]WON74226.1 hypothetical protein R5L00_01680 [Nitrosospira sp. Is2]